MQCLIAKDLYKLRKIIKITLLGLKAQLLVSLWATLTKTASVYFMIVTTLQGLQSKLVLCWSHLAISHSLFCILQCFVYSSWSDILQRIKFRL